MTRFMKFTFIAILVSNEECRLYLKVEVTAFANLLYGGYEGKAGVTDDFRDFGQSKWLMRMARPVQGPGMNS